MIHHVTCLRVSEDYTSQRDLESSKIQHVISKTFRDERQIVTKSTIAKRFLQREAACIQRSRYNSLYCMNRTSLRTRSMLKGTVYIHGETEATRRWEKVMESDGNRKKVIEPYGSLKKTQEQSIGKLGKHQEKQTGVKYERRRKRLGKEEGSP